MRHGMVGMVAGLVGALLCPGQLEAAPITFDFTGVISGVAGGGSLQNWLGSAPGRRFREVGRMMTD